MLITERNFVHIEGWMVTELGLGGNELMAYAIIYGFTQDGEHTCHVRNQYFADFLGCTKNTVTSTLKRLCDKGLIEKETAEEHGVTVNRYRCPRIGGVGQNLTGGGSKIDPGGGQKLGPKLQRENYKENLKAPFPVNNSKSELFTTPLPGGRGDKSESENLSKEVYEVIDHLNASMKAHYLKKSTTATYEIIRARLKSGLSVDDLKTIIDKKRHEWIGTDMERFLVPSTLFRKSNAEKYLNQPAGRRLRGADGRPIPLPDEREIPF